MSSPRGTLKWMVGLTSQRLRTDFSTCPGSGRPSSMARKPPLRSTMFRLLLAPKVWLHGSQSASTGFSSSRKRQTCAIICWLAHSMRWVLITTFGWPVEPEVSRYLACVSGVMASKACITAAVSGRPRAAKSSAPGWVSAPRLNTTGACSPAAAMAGPYTCASLA